LAAATTAVAELAASAGASIALAHESDPGRLSFLAADQILGLIQPAAVGVADNDEESGLTEHESVAGDSRPRPHLWLS
jgi:hypothetical protein